MGGVAIEHVRAYLLALQDRVCAALEELETGGEDDVAPGALGGETRFSCERLEEPGGGLALSRVLTGGQVLDRAAVNFSHAVGDRLPAAATAARPELAGRAYEVVSLSLIVHPRNPYAPSTHMNLRCFVARAAGAEPVWWFGGGFDLTPYYGFVEDCVHWHQIARGACVPFGLDVYGEFKRACDEYFFLPHRGEPRGIGGLFFDDLDRWGFERTFAFVRAVGDAFLPGYLPILKKRSVMPYGEHEREFQLMRRGRYVEFNLLYDRGTRYGMQSGRRVDATLASMPPLVTWRSDWRAEPDSPEARLIEDFLTPRDWLAGE